MFARGLTALTIVSMCCGTAAAQPPAPGSPYQRRPAYSPYLNLTRPGGGVVQNYYGLVRPELEFRRNVTQLNNQTAALGAQLAVDPAAELNTGHQTGYMTHLRYFGTNGGQRAGAPMQSRMPPPRR